MLLRLQMKFPSLDSVRLLRPRLGFGSPEAAVEDVCTDTDGGAAAPAIGELPPLEDEEL